MLNGVQEKQSLLGTYCMPVLMGILGVGGGVLQGQTPATYLILFICEMG